MLKSVVQQVKFAGEAFLRQQPGQITIGAHDDRYVELLRNQQRLVAERFRRAAGIDRCNLSRAAAVAARKHVKAYPTLVQQSSQRYNKGRLPASADRDISNAYHRTSQFAHSEDLTVMERIPDCHARSEDC